MISIKEVKRFRREQFNKSMALIDKKSDDYNYDQKMAGDTLFNLRVAEMLGIVPDTEAGILVRLSDKLMRLATLSKPKHKRKVKEETIFDTVRDVHNYVDYLALIWKERQGRKK